MAIEVESPEESKHPRSRRRIFNKTGIIVMSVAAGLALLRGLLIYWLHCWHPPDGPIEKTIIGYLDKAIFGIPHTVGYALYIGLAGPGHWYVPEGVGRVIAVLSYAVCGAVIVLPALRIATMRRRVVKIILLIGYVLAVLILSPVIYENIFFAFVPTM